MFRPLWRYADFKGRASRAEYWLFIAFYMTVSLGGLQLTVGQGANGLAPIIATLFSWALLPPACAVSVRRMHDIDRAGWWALILFVPLAGLLAWIVYASRDGTDGPNRYGVDPKGRIDSLSRVFAP